MEHADLVAYVRAVHARTSEVIALLDDLTGMWRPRIGEFTAGELAGHILASRAMNVRSVRGEATFYAGQRTPAGSNRGPAARTRCDVGDGGGACARRGGPRT